MGQDGLVNGNVVLPDVVYTTTPFNATELRAGRSRFELIEQLVAVQMGFEPLRPEGTYDAAKQIHFFVIIAPTLI